MLHEDVLKQLNNCSWDKSYRYVNNAFFMAESDRFCMYRISQQQL